MPSPKALLPEPPLARVVGWLRERGKVSLRDQVGAAAVPSQGVVETDELRDETL